MPTSGLSWRWPSRFSKRSVRGRVSNPLVGLTSAPALSLCVNSMPPRITEKSYRPRASNRTMVDTRSAHPVWLASRFRNRLESRTGFPSLSMISERSSPSRFASPRLTARPGRLRAVLNSRSPKRESQRVETNCRLPPPDGRRRRRSARRKILDDSVGIATHRNHRDDPVARRYITM